MKTVPIELISLEADDGKILTNGEIYSRQVYLGAMDSLENWWEIDESEIPDENEYEEI